ncbi:hypothetical protein [Helicobacter pylori]|uniref:hypothetical protein n=1 Tax=Helicobacter pylori TaxID=210 RepID=UPI001E442EB7|nr:hypothetical protein [Helicobacter pylori]
MYLGYYSIKRFFFFCHFEKNLEFFYFWRFLFRLVVLKSWLKLIFLSETHFFHLKFVFLS